MPDCPSDYTERSTITSGGRVAHVEVTTTVRNGTEQFECRVWVQNDEQHDRRAWSRDYIALTSWAKETAWGWIRER